MTGKLLPPFSPYLKIFCLQNPSSNVSRRPLRRGSFRSSSFGGVGTHRACTGPEQPSTNRPTVGQENGSKKVTQGMKRRLKVNPEDNMYRCDTRNFSQMQMIKNAAKNSANSQVSTTTFNSNL